MENLLLCTSNLEGFKKLKNESINLIITSPPYADIRKSYKGVAPHKYVDWILPIIKECYRVLTQNGSLIININDKCDKGEKIPYPFEIILKAREVGLKYIDTIIWQKKNGVAGAGRRRADYFEYIFHLAKNTKPVWHPDEIRTPYAKSSVTRAKTPIKNNVSNREVRGNTQEKKKMWKLHPRGAYPKNIVAFKKDSGKNHPAAFDIELPTHFIRAHSNEGDVVLDPFAGRGTTCQAAKLLNRRYLGFELEEEYVKLGQKLYGLNVKL